VRRQRLTATRLLLGMATACLAAVAGALFSQHVMGQQPCPWCVLQRLMFLAIAVVCLLGALLPLRPVRQLMAVMAALLGLSGIAASLWLHFVAAKSASCNLTLADKIMSATGLDARWPNVFEAKASCSDAAVKLLGVPYEFWSLTLFALMALAAWRVFGRRG
jgi:disulfide bond formation protein DsbB